MMAENTNGSTPDKTRYDYLVNARNFHYSQFNIWMMFFMVAVGALFAGYCTLSGSKHSHDFQFEIFLVLFLGYVVSLFWHWSCKGYYYWIINFIELINDYENSEGDIKTVGVGVYSCFANKRHNNNYHNPLKGANISTSAIVGIFSYIVAVSWATLLFNLILRTSVVYCGVSRLIVYTGLKCRMDIPIWFLSFLLAVLLTTVLNQFIKVFKPLHSNIAHHKDLGIL